MSNIVQRLLLFFLGVPAVVAIVFFFPQYNHGAAIFFVLAFCGGCAFELSQLFKARGVVAHPAAFVAVGAGIPAAAYCGGLLGSSDKLLGSCLGIVMAASLALVACFMPFAFSRNETDIRAVSPRSSALAFAIAYPGILGSIIVLIASEPTYATESLLTFALLCFGNDSIAWLVGVTMGKHRGIFPVSPNKSVEGFVVGMLASVGVAFACSALFPSAMAASWWELLVLGLLVGAAAICGDLFESSLKRSASIKDSGSAIPGRGGCLDSFDSLLFSAPIFYGLSLLMGLFR
jgi:phosphatidate cytidylyltransferase